jgi:hypothetical protein
MASKAGTPGLVIIDVEEGAFSFPVSNLCIEENFIVLNSFCRQYRFNEFSPDFFRHYLSYCEDLNPQEFFEYHLINYFYLSILQGHEVLPPQLILLTTYKLSLTDFNASKTLNSLIEASLKYKEYKGYKDCANRLLGSSLDYLFHNFKNFVDGKRDKSLGLYSISSQIADAWIEEPSMFFSKPHEFWIMPNFNFWDASVELSKSKPIRDIFLLSKKTLNYLYLNKLVCIPNYSLLENCPKQKECFQWIKTEKTKEVVFPDCPHKDKLEKMHGDLDLYESLN